jgi:hypothetical protein
MLEDTFDAMFGDAIDPTPRAPGARMTRKERLDARRARRPDLWQRDAAGEWERRCSGEFRRWLPATKDWWYFTLTPPPYLRFGRCKSCQKRVASEERRARKARRIAEWRAAQEIAARAASPAPK